MGIYLGLVCFLLFTSLITKSTKSLLFDYPKQEKLILKLNIFAMFLVCALRKETVGTDMLGYKEMYELVGIMPWFDFDFVYYEKGYMLLTQVLAKLGCSFQMFLVIIYAFIFFALYYFIKRYSKDVMLSLLIYICYQFFIFNLSGLRQAIASAICLLAFRFLEDKKIRSSIIFILLVLIACSIHRSAAIFFLVILIVRIKITPVKLCGYLCACFAAVVLRSNVVAFLNSNINSYETISEISLGGNFLLLVGIAAISYFTIYYASKANNGASYVDTSRNVFLFNIDRSSVCMIFLAILLYLLLTGSSMLRVVMYVSIFVVILLPNVIRLYDVNIRTILKSAIIVLLLDVLYFEELAINQFNILPYYFFWQ
jgi:hypothetical protein